MYSLSLGVNDFFKKKQEWFSMFLSEVTSLAGVE
jgi:hypothetical protein